MSEAPALERDQLRTIVGKNTSAHPAAGFAVAVLTGDRLEQVAAGSANPELNIPMTVDTVVQVGSTTKLMSAALIMRLIEDGVLDLERPIAEMIEGFRLADADATRTLNLRHCLEMTSGIDGGIMEDVGLDDDCLSRVVGALSDVPHVFPPGGGFSYSSAASVVAGRAAELAAGRRWDDLVREHVLEPAGMVHTETRPDRLMFLRVAVGIGPSGEIVRPWYPTGSMGPAGSTCASTAGDLVRLAHLFLSGGQGVNGTRVLSSESVSAISEPRVRVPTGHFAEFWCLGPHWSDSGSRVILGHPGGNSSGASILWWIPSLKVAIASVTNSVWAFEALRECQLQIAAALGWQPPRQPQADAAGPVDGADELVGVYERLGVQYEIAAQDRGLLVRVGASGVPGKASDPVRLLPAGPERFLPERSLNGFGPPTPIAFADYAGVRVLLDGHIAARRVAYVP